MVLRFYPTSDHKRSDARNGIIAIRVNGKIVARIQLPFPHPYEWQVTQDLPTGLEESAVEVFFPYGDSMAYAGLDIETGAYVIPWPLPECPLWVAYGDSITQGFSASDITLTYPFLVSENARLRVYNLGVGSRQTTVEDAMVLAGIPADLFTVLIGFNDFYRQRPPAKYAEALAAIIDQIRKTQAVAHICVITPLWSSEPIPQHPEYRLHAYRVAAQHAVHQRKSPRLHLIDGLDLIPAETKYFVDGIHPNDEGFTILASRLAPYLHSVLTS